MKLLKNLLVGASLAALPMSAWATGNTYVLHIAGSTAFRAPLTSAFIDYLGGTSCKAVFQGADNGTHTALLGATASILTGTDKHGDTLTVECYWTGSLAGVVDISVQNKINFPAASAYIASGTACTIAPYGGGAGGIIPAPTTPGQAAVYTADSSAPDVVMSDSFITSVSAAVKTASGIQISAQPGGTTGVQLSALTGDKLAAAITGAHLTEAVGNNSGSLVQPGAGGYLGIVPFEWVLGNTLAPGTTTAVATPFTNITQETASFLISNGYAPFSMFGSTATSAAQTFAFLVGRNEDSGTRIDAFAEPQLGFISEPAQNELAFDSNSTKTGANPAPNTDNGYFTGSKASTVLDVEEWPAGGDVTLNTEPSISWSNNPGHGGYVSGGDVAKALSAYVNQTSVASGSASAYNAGGADAIAPENTGGNSYFIGYISIADAGGYIAPGATTANTSGSSVTNGTYLTFNGVPFSTAAVNNGSYSFWAYEHMYYVSSGTYAIAGYNASVASATDKAQICNDIADSVSSKYAPYDSSGVLADGSTGNPGDGAGVKLIAPSSSSAITAGYVSRTKEGGAYSLSY